MRIYGVLSVISVYQQKKWPILLDGVAHNQIQLNLFLSVKIREFKQLTSHYTCMYTEWVKVLHITHSDTVISAISYYFILDLLPAFQRFLYQHLISHLKRLQQSNKLYTNMNIMLLDMMSLSFIYLIGADHKRQILTGLQSEYVWCLQSQPPQTALTNCTTNWINK